MHAPAPSQMLLPAQVSASSPFVTGVHVPVAFAQDRQFPVHALAQQVLSLQLPLAQSSAAAQL